MRPNSPPTASFRSNVHGRPTSRSGRRLGRRRGATPARVPRDERGRRGCEVSRFRRGFSDHADSRRRPRESARFPLLGARRAGRPLLLEADLELRRPGPRGRRWRRRGPRDRRRGRRRARRLGVVAPLEALRGRRLGCGRGRLRRALAATHGAEAEPGAARQQRGEADRHRQRNSAAVAGSRRRGSRRSGVVDLRRRRRGRRRLAGIERIRR